MASPNPSNVVDASARRSFPWSNSWKRFNTRASWKLVACCVQMGLAGWNDACAGALIPYMERYFHVNFVEVSTLFVGAFCGFLLSACLNNLLVDKFGRGRIIIVGALLQASGYCVLPAPPPFPLFPVTYALCIGLGIGLQMSCSYSYVTSLPDASIRLNYTQASYGTGALLSPLFATMMSQHMRFSYFFTVSLGLAIINAAILAATFGTDPEERTEHAKPSHTETIELREAQQESLVPPRKTMTTMEKNKAMLKNKNIWLTSLLLCFYVGAEVSIGGWAVSFLLIERGGSQDVGYVSTGFWAAITLGRIILPRVQARFGDRKCLYVYVALSLALEIAVWQWRSLIGNAVFVVIIGFFLSTFWGIALMNLVKLLDKPLHQSAIGIVAASGQAGSAAFPFLCGALAEKFGPISLHPVVITLLVAMAGVWWLIPEADRRTE